MLQPRLECPLLLGGIAGGVHHGLGLLDGLLEVLVESLSPWELNNLLCKLLNVSFSGGFLQFLEHFGVEGSELFIGVRFEAGLGLRARFYLGQPGGGLGVLGLEGRELLEFVLVD